MAFWSSQGTEGDGAWERMAPFPTLAMLSHLGPEAALLGFTVLQSLL